MSERTRGTIVRTFDAPHGMYGYAYAVGPDGTEYVICSEGVGWLVSDDVPLIVDTMSGPSGMYGEYNMPLTEIRELAARGTDTDLADFVRVFGARLESNFYGWQRRLSGR